MRLRAYRTDDARIITSWVRSEEELYKWSADRFNVYPLPPEVIDKSYQDQLKTGRFIPLTAVDEGAKRTTPETAVMPSMAAAMIHR